MIIVQLLGGLGNQMFQYAFGKSLAEKHNCKLLLDTSLLLNRVPCGITFAEYRLDVFNLSSRLATDKDIPLYTQKRSIKNILFRALHFMKLYFKGFKYVRYLKLQFNSKYKQLPENIYLEGYWQSEKYFKEIELVIRKDFTLNLELKGRIARMADQISSSLSAAVHIRRGDYLKYSDYHGLSDQNYISKAIKILVEKHPMIHFFIFSDDIDWCVENLKFDYPITFITQENTGSNDIEHFYLMTLCKHFIIANSTFSWWAAWLSEFTDKTVIAPAKWLTKPKLNFEDVIPDNWIKL